MSERMQLRLLTGMAIFLGMIVILLLVRYFQPMSFETPIISSGMTLQPEIIQNLTDLPDASPLSGELGAKIDQLENMLEDCDAYSSDRRRQMQQHIQWLRVPSDIPTDVAIALGENLTGKLVFGMATFTSIEWRLADRPSDSCLVSIGRFLNDLLITFNESPFTLYDEETQ